MSSYDENYVNEIPDNDPNVLTVLFQSYKSVSPDVTVEDEVLPKLT